MRQCIDVIGEKIIESVTCVYEIICLFRGKIIINGSYVEEELGQR